MPRATRWLLALLAAGAGWQALRALSEPSGRAARAALAAAGLAAGLALLARPGSGALAAAAAAGLAWLALLEAVLQRTDLLARGALGFAAGAAGTAWLLARWTRGATGRPRPTLGERSLLALFSALGALLAVEAAARAGVGLTSYDALALAPRRGPCLFRDAHGTPRANPGFRGRFVHREFGGAAVAINALGLRDGLDEAAPPADERAVVVCLGDSFAYGLGVALEDTFQERLEGLLGAPPPRVFGAGIPGFGTRDARLMLAELAPLADPDVVVLALFEENDFQDTRSARERGPMPPPAPPGASRPPAPDPLLAFLDGLASAHFWRERAAGLQLGSGRGTGRPSLFLIEALAGDPEQRLAPLCDELLDELGLLAEDARALGAELVVLLVPAALQAEPARFERWAAQSSDAGRADRLGFHRALAERLEGLGYRVVDPLPLLEAQAREGRSGYHLEGHWNALGHDAAARALAPVVRDLLGVD